MVVGMGYVGIPVAALFAQSGLQATGLDIDEAKVEALAQGRYPLSAAEPELPELIAANVAAGRLRATTDYDVVKEADAVLVCVDTPFDTAAGRPDYRGLEAVCRGIASRLRSGMLVVIESTIAPTTMDQVVRPLLEDGSGLVAGKDFHLGHCPERVMPGKLLHNLRHYDRVLGGIDTATQEAMRGLYSRIVSGPLTPVDLLTAEVTKSFENTYRDVEIALANEFARYCDGVGVDFFQVRELVNKVESRNLHLPGTGVGGHCIPKDTYLLAYGSRGRFEPTMMLMARQINDAMPHVLAARVLEALGPEPAGRRVAVLGYAYLPESSDARHSPSEPLAQALEAAGVHVVVHDPYVTEEVGRTLERDLATVLQGAHAAVVATAHPEYAELGLDRIQEKMAGSLLADGRHMFERTAAEAAGFTYIGIGH